MTSKWVMMLWESEAESRVRQRESLNVRHVFILELLLLLLLILLVLRLVIGVVCLLADHVLVRRHDKRVQDDGTVFG